MWDWLDLESELEKPQYQKGKWYEVFGVRFCEEDENGTPFWNEDIYGMDVMWPDYKSAKAQFENEKLKFKGGYVYTTDIRLDNYNLDDVYNDSYEARMAVNGKL